MLSLHLNHQDGTPLDRLAYRNERGGRFSYRPTACLLVPELRGDTGDRLLTWEVSVPPGWKVVPGKRIVATGSVPPVWHVEPRGIPRRCRADLSVTVRDRSTVVARAATTVPIDVHGVSTFDPARDRLPWANRVDEFGPVTADEHVFRETFRLALLPRRFQHGLYAVVVRLGGGQGGVCTGMARVALARSLGLLRAEGSDLRRAVLVLHGRQLTDRALLAGAVQFLWPSPRRAYRAFVDDLLRRGWSDLCFDVNVPKPWRRDVVSALLGQGHTVVPYAFHQSSDERADVVVYDPNRPDAAAETVITFDLARDRYRYPPLVDEDDPVTIIAVRLHSYLRGRTALLSSLASLVLFGPGKRRTALGTLVVGAICVLLLRILVRVRRERPVVVW